MICPAPAASEMSGLTIRVPAQSPIGKGETPGRSTLPGQKSGRCMQTYNLYYNDCPMLNKLHPASEERVQTILQCLNAAFPNAQCALAHSNPLELLIATILSAQCTDERVNLVTKDMFQKYRKPEDYIRVPQATVETDIRSTGFYHNKAKSIQGSCRMILEKFGSSVPNTMEELLQLPGVARKTANVVLGVAFGKAEGIVVDTHVFRVSRRLDLTTSETAERIERDLMLIIPQNRWIAFSHQMILHGRTTCKARKPLCVHCAMEKDCDSEDKIIR
jgi:endonuclease-3